MAESGLGVYRCDFSVTAMKSYAGRAKDVGQLELLRVAAEELTGGDGSP